MRVPAAGAAELRENRPDAQREPVMDDLPSFETHRVDNQPPPFEPRDLWADDLALREAVAGEGASAFASRLAAYGALAGDELYRLGVDANRDRPRSAKAGATQQAATSVAARFLYMVFLYMALKKESPRRWGTAAGVLIMAANAGQPTAGRVYQKI